MTMENTFAKAAVAYYYPRQSDGSNLTVCIELFMPLCTVMLLSFLSLWGREGRGAARRVSYLVDWCFEPSQPLGITSGLKEAFIKRYIVERTSKTETGPEGQSEKKESCWEKLE